MDVEYWYNAKALICILISFQNEVRLLKLFDELQYDDDDGVKGNQEGFVFIVFSNYSLNINITAGN